MKTSRIIIGAFVITALSVIGYATAKQDTVETAASCCVTDSSCCTAGASCCE
jgi:hypothetical protein|uniref:hypothetical protein n=1 Tax=Cephaloticoccus sp. TaxID=1985742 RepID=UPI00404A9E3E